MSTFLFQFYDIIVDTLNYLWSMVTDSNIASILGLSLSTILVGFLVIWLFIKSGVFIK